METFLTVIGILMILLGVVHIIDWVQKKLNKWH